MGMGKHWEMALKLHDTDAEILCHTYRNLLHTHTHTLKLDDSMPQIATTFGFCGQWGPIPGFA